MGTFANACAQLASHAPHSKVSQSVELAKCHFFIVRKSKLKTLGKETWMNKMSAIILCNSRLTHASERWLCINYNTNYNYEIKCELWPTIIKYACWRSLFKALKKLCFNKYKSNLRTLRKKTWKHKMFSIILWSSLIHQNKKDTLVYRHWVSHSRSLSCTIASFPRVFLQKISPFPECINRNLVILCFLVVLYGPWSEYPKE